MNAYDCVQQLLSYLVFYGNVGRKRLATKAAAKERVNEREKRRARLPNCPAPAPNEPK